MTALNQLGYKCYHMLETGAAENIKQNHVICWREALSYKVYGTGKAYGPNDFDKILQNYSVSVYLVLLCRFLVSICIVVSDTLH